LNDTASLLLHRETLIDPTHQENPHVAGKIGFIGLGNIANRFIRSSTRSSRPIRLIICWWQIPLPQAQQLRFEAEASVAR
jgi:hypothetical protein